MEEKIFIRQHPTELNISRGTDLFLGNNLVITVQTTFNDAVKVVATAMV